MCPIDSLTMSVDKFGRHESVVMREVLRGPPGHGFNLTFDGDYDVKNKRIVNLADPVSDNEAVNLQTVEKLSLVCKDETFDAKHKRICNLGEPKSDTDAVNRRYLLKEINKLKRELKNLIKATSVELAHREIQPEVIQV